MEKPALKFSSASISEMAHMEKHEAFKKWALSQGVKLYGVKAHRFPGRGLGIVATEAAEVCPIFFVSSFT